MLCLKQVFLVFCVLMLGLQIAVGAPGDEQWDDGFSVPGVNGTVYAVVKDGGNVYVGGTFTLAGDVPANNIARWDGSRWHAIGEGLTHNSNGACVNGVVVINGAVYAGGQFNSSGDAPLNNLARWTGAVWIGVGNGCNNEIRALGNYNGDLVIGGDFTSAGSSGIGYLAIWDMMNWSGLGTGVNGPVYSIATNGDDLYAGGEFTAAGGSSAGCVAHWDGSQWWSMGSGMASGISGMDPVVRAIVQGSGFVYAGGDFTSAGGTTVHHIARWNGSSWSALGSGVEEGLMHIISYWFSPVYRQHTCVNALFAAGTDLYAGGDFTLAGGEEASMIALWDGSAWSGLSSGMEAPVHAIGGITGQIVAGGAFFHAGQTGIQRIARWSGSSWSTLGEGQGISRPASQLTTDGSLLYAGGNFLSAGSAPAVRAASFNGTGWSALGEGLYEWGVHESGDIIDPEVNAVVYNDPYLYAAGYFKKAGTDNAGGFARWNGTAWQGLSAGIMDPENGYEIHELAAGGGDVYLAGYYFYNNMAQNVYMFQGVVGYDGVNSYALEPDIPRGTINDIAYINGDVYAGGWFTEANDAPADYIARWNGTEWESLGEGVNGMVTCITEYAGLVVAGGQFTTAGGITVNHVAAWDGTEWSGFNSGFNEMVTALAAGGGSLYASGAFTEAIRWPSNTAVNHAAVWNGETVSWQPLGSGLDMAAGTIAVIGDQIYFSGGFNEAGDKISQHIACWHETGGGSIPALNFIRLPHPLFTQSAYSTLGMAWCDFDNDGDADIFMANDNHEMNHMYRNLGQDIELVTVSPVTTTAASSTGATWGDYNNDGNPDLYVSQLGAPGALYRNDGNGNFTSIPLMTDTLNSFGAAWADYNLDGFLDLYITVRGDKNRLYQNNGDGTFTRIMSGAPVSTSGISLSASWCDYDLDGDPDLFVARGDNENNGLYRNDGNGFFTAITSGPVVTDGGNSWGGSWGDFNTDGYPDLFVANNGQPNFLYENLQDGTFLKITTGPIVTDNHHSRSSAWADVDQDGDLDLFVSNRTDSCLFYMNKGLGNFDRYCLSDGNSRGAAFADWDRDGDMDLFISDDGGQNALFVNQMTWGTHWLQVQCVGSKSNRSGIGAVVCIKAMNRGRMVWQTREISSQTGFGGQNEMIAHFGLKDADVVDSLQIRWPGGAVWDTSGVAADQRLIIREAGAAPVNRNPVAVDDSVTIAQDSTVIVHVLLNDTDPEHDPLSILECGNSENFSACFIASGDTTLVLIPEADFSGTDRITYIISDGQGGRDTADVIITVLPVTAILRDAVIPDDYALYQNYPNPFNPTTRIQYDLPEAAEVRLIVYDIMARAVANVVSGKQQAGRYQAAWDGLNDQGHPMPSGVYFYRLQAGKFSAVKKMLLIR